MQHQPQHGPAAAPAPLQTRQRRALLRFKRIQAADTQILPADWRKAVRRVERGKGFTAPSVASSSSPLRCCQ